MAKPVWVRVAYQAGLALSIRWPVCVLPIILLFGMLSEALRLPHWIQGHMATGLFGAMAAVLAWAIVRSPWDGLVTCLTWTVALVQLARERDAARGEPAPFLVELSYQAPMSVWLFVGCALTAFIISRIQRSRSRARAEA